MIQSSVIGIEGGGLDLPPSVWGLLALLTTVPVTEDWMAERRIQMSREREGFRDQLVRLDERFPDKELLSVSDVAIFTGIDPRTAKLLYSFNPANKISKVLLASEMVR